MKIIKPTFLGIIAAGGALVIELCFLFFLTGGLPAGKLILGGLTPLLILAAGMEELSKFLVISRGLLREQDGKLIFPSALLVGFGFALFELFLKSGLEISGSFKLYSGMLGIILVHMLTAGLIGYLAGRLKEIRILHAAGIVLLAAALHLLYNLAVLGGYLQN